MGPLGAAEGSSSVTSMKYALVVFVMERPKSLATMSKNSPWSIDRCILAITSTGVIPLVTLTVNSTGTPTTSSVPASLRSGVGLSSETLTSVRESTPIDVEINLPVVAINRSLVTSDVLMPK